MHATEMAVLPGLQFRSVRMAVAFIQSQLFKYFKFVQKVAKKYIHVTNLCGSSCLDNLFFSLLDKQVQ